MVTQNKKGEVRNKIETLCSDKQGTGIGGNLRARMVGS